MTTSFFKKPFALLIVLGGLGLSSFYANAATVTLDFDWLPIDVRDHGTTITEDGYTLTSTGFSSIKPADLISNGTTSLFTQLASVTITKSVGGIFDLFSIDFGEMLSTATPIVGISAVKEDATILTDDLVISGLSSFWTYRLDFSDQFTNLTSVTLFNKQAALFQFDNIVVSAAGGENGTGGVNTVPLPGALPIYASGLIAFSLAIWRRRKNTN